MKKQDKSDNALALRLKPSRGMLWLMIPVLMALILILNLTAPGPDQQPTKADHALWLLDPKARLISLITDQPTPWQQALNQRFPKAVVEIRDLGPMQALRIRGPSDWLTQDWPAPVHALVVMHDIELAQWESAISRLSPQANLTRPRAQLDFIQRVLAARLAEQASPEAQFDGQRLRLIEQLTQASGGNDAQIALLERMAMENLPLAWPQQTVNTLQSLTFQELSPWLTP